jgi:hypothetical protein
MKRFNWWVLMLLGGAVGALLTLGAIPEVFHGIGGVIGDQEHVAYHVGEICGALLLLCLGIFLMTKVHEIPDRLRQLDAAQPAK